VGVGDVVVAQNFVQHDMDASPLFARYEIPEHGSAILTCDVQLTALLLRAVQAGLAGVGRHFHQGQWLPAATVHTGLVASGDQFVSEAAAARQMLSDLQAAGFSPLAVEMEGAAVAQVCHDYGVPFAAVRTISDRADDSAHADFSAFVTQVAGPYARAVIGQLMTLL